MGLGSWFPEGVSTFSADIDHVFYLIYYIVGFWFVLTQVLLLYFVFRYRRREGRRSVYATGESLSQAAWILVPAAIVLVLDLAIDHAGATVWTKVKERLPETDQRVHVSAKQFNWEITYPGPDKRFGTDDDLTIENDLHVPVGTDIIARLASKDVLHSFFLPQARLKQDVVPGREIDVWFNITKAGEYEIACAELCGFGHYTMRGRLIVHEPDSYRAWVAKRWPSS